MQNRVTVTWLSAEDKMSNPTFVSERHRKMISMGITKADIISPSDESYATITFRNELDAAEWVSFIQALANKYNKQIVDITVG